MKVRLLYFAWVRERAGVSEEELELPAELVSVADLIAWQQGRGAGFAEAFSEESKLRCALDQEHAERDAPLKGAREIAFFPPVTGG